MKYGYLLIYRNFQCEAINSIKFFIFQLLQTLSSHFGFLKNGFSSTLCIKTIFSTKTNPDIIEEGNKCIMNK